MWIVPIICYNPIADWCGNIFLQVILHRKSLTEILNMENVTNISSDGQHICQYAVSIFYTTAMAIISLAALIGNILAIRQAPSTKL